MKINKVTITGADDKTEPYKLFELSQKYPFVEWGILFSQSKKGESRYPSYDYIKKISNFNLNLSAHFCGWWSKTVLEAQEIHLINCLSTSFKRVQLNYNFSNSNKWNLETLLYYSKQNKNRSLILQYNKSNSKFLEKIATQKEVYSNIDFLYDSSGGRGVEIKEVKSPIQNYHTGYSGGINVENIDAISLQINRFENSNNVWIDLESGIRTNDEFDLSKVEKILEKMKFFVNF